MKFAKFACIPTIFMALLCALPAKIQAVEQQETQTTTKDNAPQASQENKSKVWYDRIDIGLRLATVTVLSLGLVGTFAVLTSLRASAYSQIYSRFQALLLRLSENPELFDRMKTEEYTDAENNPNSVDEKTKPHRFIANVMVNLYEEAYLLYKSRILLIFDPLPSDYWQSILGSMQSAFQLKYVRTHWEKRQQVFSNKFNQFIRDEILREAR
jgi:hypothetical protein